VNELQRLLTDVRFGVSAPLGVLRGTERLTIPIVPAEAAETR
jgi:hypothetical protein